MAEDKDDRYDTRSDIEDFIKENREILEDLIRREKEDAENIFNRGKDRAREHVEKTKRESQNSMKQAVNAIMDPEIQGHFMSAGFDFILGVNALMRAMPQPKFMRESEFEDSEDLEDMEEEVPTPKKRASPKSIKIETPEDVPLSPPKKTTTRSRKKSATAKGKE